jgi:hypothetical protein
VIPMGPVRQWVEEPVAGPLTLLVAQFDPGPGEASLGFRIDGRSVEARYTATAAGHLVKVSGARDVRLEDAGREQIELEVRMEPEAGTHGDGP